MHNFIKIKLKSLIELITDYHANGSYKILKSNVTIKYHKDYAIMIRTLNFEQKNFYSDLIYVDEKAYNFLSKSKVFPYDILINKIANPGSVYMMPDINAKITCGMNLFLIRFSNQVDQIYMYYHLKHNENKIKNLAHGTTTKTITKDDIRDFETIIHSDIKIQNKISALLHNLDKLIEKQNLIYSELEKMAKTLYDYWFVQFDFPDENGRPYKSSGGKMVWNNELKKEIPYGWEVKNIVDNPFTSLISVGVEYFNSKNYLATKNINGEIISDGEFITYENRETRANMQPQINSIWFAKMQNSIKHITLPNNSQWFVDKYILSTGFFGLKCQKDALSYIHCFINAKYFENKKDTLAHGATQKAVNASDIENILLLIPTLDTLKQFNDKVYSLLEMKLEIIKQNQELISLRDFLLPLLMNGQAVIKE